MSQAKYHQCNESIQMAGGKTVMSRSASLIQLICAATDCLRQATSDRKYEKWCKFSSHITAKLHKTNSCKTRPACMWNMQQLKWGKIFMLYYAEEW
jgi:hypothetical protein